MPLIPIIVHDAVQGPTKLERESRYADVDWLSEQQFPLIASLPLLLMSMGQFDHPFWFHARPMVTKIGAMSVSKQA